MNQVEAKVQAQVSAKETGARLTLARVMRALLGPRPAREAARLLGSGAVLERDGRTWKLDGKPAGAPAALAAPVQRLFDGLRLSALRLDPGVKGYEVAALRELMGASAASLMDLKLDDWLALRGVRRVRLKRDRLAAACHDLAAELNSLGPDA